MDAITPQELASAGEKRTPATNAVDVEKDLDHNLSPIIESVESDLRSARVLSSTVEVNSADPMNFGRHRRDNVTRRQMKIDHPNGDKKQLKKFYTRQNELIDQFLGSDDEERLAVEEDVRMAPKIKFAVYASFTVNFFLFVIQLYAAVSTGSLSVVSSKTALLVGLY
jgi:hypothetical protein